jgi:hypothetical protein
MSAFADGSIDVAFFSCNGISMVDHPGRIRDSQGSLADIVGRWHFHLLHCNRLSWQYRARFRWPDYQATWNPVRAACAPRDFSRKPRIAR